MADLRIKTIDPKLKAQLKSEAALANTTLELYVINILQRRKK
jgi:hypothetical protein